MKNFVASFLLAAGLFVSAEALAKPQVAVVGGETGTDRQYQRVTYEKKEDEIIIRLFSSEANEEDMANRRKVQKQVTLSESKFRKIFRDRMEKMDQGGLSASERSKLELILSSKNLEKEIAEHESKKKTIEKDQETLEKRLDSGIPEALGELKTKEKALARTEKELREREKQIADEKVRFGSSFDPRKEQKLKADLETLALDRSKIASDRASLELEAKGVKDRIQELKSAVASHSECLDLLSAELKKSQTAFQDLAAILDKMVESRGFLGLGSPKLNETLIFDRDKEGILFQVLSEIAAQELGLSKPGAPANPTQPQPKPKPPQKEIPVQGECKDVRDSAELGKGCRTAKGAVFERVAGGWKDPATDLTWSESKPEAAAVNFYQADQFCRSQGMRLPTAQEFEDAAARGVSEFLPSQSRLWSGTKHPKFNSNFYFDTQAGKVSDRTASKDQSTDASAVRCVK
jgi:hypothetical protein